MVNANKKRLIIQSGIEKAIKVLIGYVLAGKIQNC
jgi:hypothetical protein